MHQLVDRFASSLFSYNSHSRFAILAMGPECCAPLTVDRVQWSASDRSNWNAAARTMTKLAHEEDVRVFQITINYLSGEI